MVSMTPALLARCGNVYVNSVDPETEISEQLLTMKAVWSTGEWRGNTEIDRQAEKGVPTMLGTRAGNRY